MKTKPKFKGFEKENGEIVRTAYFDGYAFGDRILEGVRFRCDVQKDGTLKVECAPRSRDYFSTLAEKKWLKDALAFAEEADIFSEDEEGEGDQLFLIAMKEAAEAKPRSTASKPIAIKKTFPFQP